MKSSWTLMGVVSLSLTGPAAGQVYTQARQTRQISTAVTARVPGQPDAADADSHTSDAPGSFNQLVTSGATAAVPGSDPMVFASGNVEALGSMVLGDVFMTGGLAADYRVDSHGGDAGINSNLFFQTEFTVPVDTPYRLATHLTVTFDPAADDGSRDAGGGILIQDLDTEDPHGGPTTVFGYFVGTDSAWDRQFDGSGTFLAGHRYVLQLEADAGRELLNNPPRPGTHVSHGRSELTFRLDLPEPPAAAALPGVALLLSRRRR